MPAPKRPRHFATETALVSVLALLLALAALRAGAWWSRGVVGGGDAWQMLWSIDHVQRALRGEEPLFFSARVWAPEGASLRAHGLSLTNTVPAAVVASRFGLFAGYNIMVLFSFVLAAATSYRLARRLGASALGAALGALVFAFAPQRMARALGHLNLLSIGWIPLALEGLLLASRETGRRRIGGILLGAFGMAALAYSEWYLALMGAMTAASFALFECARAPRERRAGTAAAMALSGLVALAAVLPTAMALARESAAQKVTGHDPNCYSTSVTSLVIPSRVQLVSRLTPALTARERLTVEEGSNYLGFVPLVATLAVAFGRRRERELDFALVAGGISLVLSLGPALWVFSRPLDFPLPYSLLERVLPVLRLGGAAARFQALAFLPLALGTALWATRLLAAGRRALWIVAPATALLLVEFAPADPGHAVWPFDPPDPAMVAISSSGIPGNVLDVDPGNLNMIHQLQHGRPQIFGCISRTPPVPLARRLQDPILRTFLEPDRPAPALPRAAAAALLRHRWHVAFVISPSFPEFESKARALGFPEIVRSERGDRAVVFGVPDDPLPSIGRVDFEKVARGVEGIPEGIVADGLHGPETPVLDSGEEPGCWSGRDVSLFAPLRPGDYRLRVAAPRPMPPRMTLRWGAGREVSVRVDRTLEVALPIARDDRLADGMVELEIRVTPTYREPGKNGRELGVFLISIAR